MVRMLVGSEPITEGPLEETVRAETVQPVDPRDHDVGGREGSAAYYLDQARRGSEPSEEPDYEKIASNAERLLKRLEREGDQLSVPLHEFDAVHDSLAGIRTEKVRPQRFKERLEAAKAGLERQTDYHAVREVRAGVTGLLRGIDGAAGVAELAVALQSVPLEGVARVYSRLTRLEKMDLHSGLQEAVDGQFLNATDVPVLREMLLARSYQSNELDPSEGEVDLILGYLEILSDPARAPKALRNHVRPLQNGLKGHPTRLFKQVEAYLTILEAGYAEGARANFDPSQGLLLDDRLSNMNPTKREMRVGKERSETRESYVVRAGELRERMEPVLGTLGFLVEASEYVRRTVSDISDMDADSAMVKKLEKVVGSESQPAGMRQMAYDLIDRIQSSEVATNVDLRPAPREDRRDLYEGRTYDRFGRSLGRSHKSRTPRRSTGEQEDTRRMTRHGGLRTGDVLEDVEISFQQERWHGGFEYIAFSGSNAVRIESDTRLSPSDGTFTGTVVVDGRAPSSKQNVYTGTVRRG